MSRYLTRRRRPPPLLATARRRRVVPTAKDRCHRCRPRPAGSRKERSAGRRARIGSGQAGVQQPKVLRAYRYDSGQAENEANNPGLKEVRPSSTISPTPQAPPPTVNTGRGTANSGSLASGSDAGVPSRIRGIHMDRATAFAMSSGHMSSARAGATRSLQRRPGGHAWWGPISPRRLPRSPRSSGWIGSSTAVCSS